ncbi:MAG: recombination-associated protein RdgC, partial [Paucibacter sp.]|nr:recombination-associated protein RdgC [Roseateles sp.]
MFKNLMVYRIGAEWQSTVEAIEERLQTARFVECGATQALSMGWTEPRGIAHGPLIEDVGGHWLLKLMVEQRVLPGSVVRKRLDEMAERIEQETGRKP